MKKFLKLAYDVIIKFFLSTVLPIAIITLVIGSLLFIWNYFAPEHFKPVDNNDKFISYIYEDKEGCIYKIIEPKRSNNRMGVIALNEC